MIRLLAILGMLFSLALVALPQPALADKPIVVGNGTAASCTETALKDALLVAQTIGGGTIEFKCGPTPVTIVLTQATEIDQRLVHLVVPNNTTIEGGGLITLTGISTTIVLVENDTTVALQGVSIACSIMPPQVILAGGIINFGRLTFRKSTLSDCFTIIAGGIWSTGELTIIDSLLSGNYGDLFAGGVESGGKLSVKRTTFAHNGTLDGQGGAIANFGALTIDDSTFVENSGFVTADGGAIATYGTATINNSTFSGNVAEIGGGAIWNGGTLTVNKSGFFDNAALFDGGGIHSLGVLRVDGSTFSGNAARSGGGIFTRPDSFTSLRHNTFSGNSASQGGGIFNGGALEIFNSTLSSNAGFWGGGIFNAAALTAKGSVITDNTASFGGGIYLCLEGQEIPVSVHLIPISCQGTLNLTHTTITGNEPEDIFP
jgi:hypothetical protein